MFSVQFDEGRAVLDKDITAENIQTFVSGEQLPLVVEFNDEVCEYSNYKYLSNFFFISATTVVLVYQQL